MSADGLARAWQLIRVALGCYGVVKLVAWAWLMGPSWVNEFKSKRGQRRAAAKRWWIR